MNKLTGNKVSTNEGFDQAAMISDLHCETTANRTSASRGVHAASYR